MQNLAEKTVAEIVSDNIKTADVFKRNGIDFCCGGHVNVKTVCDKKGIDFNVVENELNRISEDTSPSHDFKSWDLEFLIDYIIHTHHQYVNQNISLLLEYSNKVATVHGHHYAEVVEVRDLVEVLVADLKNHMMKEENVLFPAVKQMLAIVNNHSGDYQPHFGSVQNPITVMEHEHDAAGDIIKRIAKLTNNFTPPAEACNTFKALYSKLEEFQNDLFQHVHLENNILFPKAKDLEKQLNN